MSAASPDPQGAALSYRHPVTGEWAHDVRDPLAEAREVFVAPAWEARPPRAGHGPLRILEAGFGRGLNSACALARIGRQAPGTEVAVLGLEPCPEALRPWPPCPAELVDLAPWWGRLPGCWELGEAPRGSVRVRAAAAPAGLAGEQCFDWIFLDLFSPSRHPQDWRPDLLAGLSRAAAPGAVLTSYCVARVLRDGLVALGWRVERLPRGRSRHSLRAVLPGVGEDALGMARREA